MTGSFLPLGSLPSLCWDPEPVEIIFVCGAVFPVQHGPVYAGNTGPSRPGSRPPCMPETRTNPFTLGARPLYTGITSPCIPWALAPPLLEHQSFVPRTRAPLRKDHEPVYTGTMSPSTSGTRGDGGQGYASVHSPRHTR